VSVPAVGAGDQVTVAQGEAGTHRHRFLADRQVHGAVHHAPAVKVLYRLFEEADPPHVREDSGGM